MTVVIASSRADFWTPSVEAKLVELEFERIDSFHELSAETLSAIAPSSIYFPYWNWRIPDDILAEWRCVIFHIGDLRYFRGGSPLQHLIRGGEKTAPLNAILADSGFDSGPVLLARTVSLRGSAREIFPRVSEQIADLILEILHKNPTPQDQLAVGKIQKRLHPYENQISSDLSIDQLYDEIRMVDADDYLPAFLRFGQYDIEFFDVSNNNGLLEGRFRIRPHLDARDGPPA